MSAPEPIREMRRRNAIIAISLVLCLVLLGAIAVRERCRLADIDWSGCQWFGLPVTQIGPGNR